MTEGKIGTREDWQAARDELAKLEAEHAELTRKVTDKGRLPRSRQLGITGRAIAPDLYVAIVCAVVRSVLAAAVPMRSSDCPTQSSTRSSSKTSHASGGALRKSMSP